jgi:hypothetical protein
MLGLHHLSQNKFLQVIGIFTKSVVTVRNIKVVKAMPSGFRHVCRHVHNIVDASLWVS